MEAEHSVLISQQLTIFIHGLIWIKAFLYQHFVFRHFVRQFVCGQFVHRDFVSDPSVSLGWEEVTPVSTGT